MYLSTHFSASLDVFFFSLKALERKTPEDYNFILVQKGTITVHDGSEQYILSQGDVCLLEPGQTYEINHFSNNFCLNIQFGRKFIERLIPHDGILICNSAVGRKNDYRELCRVLIDIAMIYPKGDNENQIISLLFRFMDILQHDHIRTRKKGTDDIITNRINEIQTYIQQNFHLPLSLQELAEQMYLSPQYLSKFIKQNMGITFIHYLNNVRMEHAYEELMNTDHSVTEIAFNNGFSNTAAFNKSFREIYHESPSAHRLGRNLISQKMSPEWEADIRKFNKYSGSGNTPEPIRIFIKQNNPYYPSWSDTINIGALSNALSSRFHDAFMQSQRTIGFRYVRFDDIFSEEIMRPLNGGKGFDYANLNMVLDFFEEIHILPFIELSYKPHKKDLINFRKYSAEESFRGEKKASYYQYALGDLLRHCINRYGYSSVSQWRFEIWQKHDESLQYISAAKEYVKKFRIYREIIKNLLPSAKVGGPGFNTSAEKINFIEILEEMNRQQIYPDFYSIYIYCHTPGCFVSHGSAEKTRSILSNDADIFAKLYRSYAQTIREIMPGSAPIYITEFNSGLMGSNYVSASSFQAAFICKSVLTLFRETPCIAYWHFSDEARQFSSVPRQYSTDTGLIDSHGIPKAPLFAYFMLSRLQEKLIGYEDDYIITGNGSNRYQFLAYNYVHYNQNYCLNFETPLEISHTYDVFEKSAPKSMEVRLSCLPSGRYKITKTTLNQKYGSIIDEFIRIFNEGYLTPEELNYMILNIQEEERKYYLHTIRPKQDTYYVETDGNNSLSFSFTMEPHEVVLFELARKV